MPWGWERAGCRPSHGQGHRAAGPPRHVRALCPCLMVSAPAGPAQAEAKPVGRLGQGQEQPAHLGHRERDQGARRIGIPFFPLSPFGVAVAWARVTSK
jgi:hypothetical protein